ncbi:PREDICTED: glutamic acid-rich protein-like isoform X1 [Polistes canadensis]|uniref:glutamic acid-rich protein-like isoform X1 n=2 Tax=Polistes canadensis TaxID=91411 RepID=UPI000718F33B|nr:PREDICTED: glutamic acid-rich protein-like isoform X1 [Polistes canadensis]
MKHQQITVDLSNMVFTAFSYLALAGAVWIFLRLLQACFWLPRHLKKQNDVQQMLQDKVDDYERYILDCEEKEKTMILEGESTEEQNAEMMKKWKERRECFEMMKRELKKVRDGGEINDWDYLLEEEQKLEEEEEAKRKEKESENEEGVKITEIPEEKLSKREKKHDDNKKSSDKLDGSPKKSENVDLLIGKEEPKEKDEEETKKDK